MIGVVIGIIAAVVLISAGFALWQHYYGKSESMLADDGATAHATEDDELAAAMAASSAEEGYSAPALPLSGDALHSADFPPDALSDRDLRAECQAHRRSVFPGIPRRARRPLAKRWPQPLTKGHDKTGRPEPAVSDHAAAVRLAFCHVIP